MRNKMLVVAGLLTMIWVGWTGTDSTEESSPPQTLSDRTAVAPQKTNEMVPTPTETLPQSRTALEDPVSREVTPQKSSPEMSFVEEDLQAIEALLGDEGRDYLDRAIDAYMKEISQYDARNQ